MSFKIEKREFSITKGSDVIRDGVFVELNEIINGKEKWLFEIFYYDESGKKECMFSEASIPYEALKTLIEAGDNWLEPG